ncbi:YezD family protein [Neobacillus sp. K501]
MLSLKGGLDQQTLEKIASLLEGLEFGTVQITVHDSQITQIDRLEKHRLPLRKQQALTSKLKRKE